jgi:shikimate dehydrogenase
MKVKLALIGNPLSHSYSKDIFTRIFERDGVMDASYELIQIPELSAIREIIEEHKLDAFNVTIPHKKNITAYLDEVSPQAWDIMAVNFVMVNRSKERIILSGHNTDCLAFKESLTHFSFTTKKALVLGDGGAAAAVVFALQQSGFLCTRVSRRAPQNGTVSYADIDAELVRSVSLIVNATPLGMYPDTEACPDIPYQELCEGHLVYDLIYNPDKTLFLKTAESYGARIKNGREMLELQAETAWNILRKDRHL